MREKRVSQFSYDIRRANSKDLETGSLKYKELSMSTRVGANEISEIRRGRRSKEAENKSRFSDQSLLGSSCLANSSMNRKVSYNISQNSLRKKLITDLQAKLSLLLITGKDISQMDNSSALKFDKEKEGFMVGTCTIKFHLKDVPEEKTFYLDYCGDQLYELNINGLSIPVETVQWTNNQLFITGLRIGKL